MPELAALRKRAQVPDPLQAPRSNRSRIGPMSSAISALPQPARPNRFLPAPNRIQIRQPSRRRALRPPARWRQRLPAPRRPQAATSLPPPAQLPQARPGLLPRTKSFLRRLPPEPRSRQLAFRGLATPRGELPRERQPLQRPEFRRPPALQSQRMLRLRPFLQPAPPVP